MSIKEQRSFVKLVRETIECRECFRLGEVSAPFINVAQPRSVGPKYWDSSCRVAILMINPGRSPKNSAGAKTFLRVIKKFRAGTMELQTILQGQREAMERWGRFKGFYIDGLGLDFADIALANVAWCATKENTYPRKMLKRCFMAHTGPLLQLLRPDVVIASGKSTHAFADDICRLLPTTTVIKTLHYSHRKRHAAEEADLKRLRSVLTVTRAECRRRADA
jgi:hypothetical protein